MSRDTTGAMQSMTGDMLKRVAVFGISRSGKDYSIEGAVDRLSASGINYMHVSMIRVVRGFLNGRKLSEMDFEEKRKLMDKVHLQMDNIASYDNVIVDEHYCFPSYYGGKKIHTGYVDEKLPYVIKYDDELDMVYEVVFDNNEINKYDQVFYLDIDPEVILGRFRTSEGAKRNEFITLEDVRNWMLFEKYNIQSLCASHGIPFICLKDPNKTSDDIVRQIV